MDNSGNVCFQVNATIKELGNQNVDISTSTAGSHQSSLMFSQGASSNMEDTPHKTDTLSSPLTPLTPQGSVATTKYLVRFPTAYINSMLQHVWFILYLDAGNR
jgi:hypothetical protein